MRDTKHDGPILAVVPGVNRLYCKPVLVEHPVFAAAQVL
jgi:hypothetical protein